MCHTSCQICRITMIFSDVSHFCQNGRIYRMPISSVILVASIFTHTSLVTMSRQQEVNTPVVDQSGVTPPADVNISGSSQRICLNDTLVKNKTKYISSNTKPKYRRSHHARHVVFDLCHVERRVTKEKSPGKITLQLPPNLSQKNKNQNYLISLTVRSDAQGYVKKASVSKVDGNFCGKNFVGLCSVCWENPCDLIFLPCGHVTTCHGCGVKMHVTRMKCPLCRGVITDINDVFFSGDDAK